jgi:methylenetetrahydrofolate reductase (NADPH)
LAPTNLQAALNSGSFVLTAEVAPPLSADPEDLLRKTLPLKGLASAINVTDAAGARAALDPLAAAAILVQNGIEPILQLTTRDRNRIALQSALVGAAALGVRNVMFLMGDHPSRGDQPETKPVFDLDSVALMQTAAAIRDKGELPGGRKVAGKAEFFIGCADRPLDPPADWSPIGLMKKLEAGAQFVQTQFCMDAGVVRRYLARLKDAGIAARLLVGTAPLLSAKQAHWIRENLPGSIISEAIVRRMEAASDQKTEGVRVCVDFLREIAEIPGVAGGHVMAPLNGSALVDVLREMQR